ncbi:MAG: hypothetical protein JNK05_00345 [Myxococcales bacterium]|nr:hypothetical protein [Myxococcales bacterium]
MNAHTINRVLEIASPALPDDDGLFDDADSPVTILGRGRSFRASTVISVVSKVAAREMLLAYDSELTGPIVVVAGILGSSRQLVLRDVLTSSSASRVRYLGDPDPADWIAFETLRQCVVGVLPHCECTWMLKGIAEGNNIPAPTSGVTLAISSAEKLVMSAIVSLGLSREVASVVGRDAFALWESGAKIELEGLRRIHGVGLSLHLRAKLQE